MRGEMMRGEEKKRGKIQHYAASKWGRKTAPGG